MSCGSARNVKIERQDTTIVREQRADSLVTVVYGWETQMVPMSEVSMTLDLDSIAKLPSGAVYTERSGRATARVSRDEKNRLVVNASCDSVEQVVKWYEKTLSNVTRSNEELKTANKELNETMKESRSNMIRTVFLSFIAGMVSGILFLVLILKNK